MFLKPGDSCIRHGILNRDPVFWIASSPFPDEVFKKGEGNFDYRQKCRIRCNIYSGKIESQIKKGFFKNPRWYSFSFGVSPRLLWHVDLKACSLTRLAGLGDGDICYGEDLPGKIEAHSGILPKPPIKYPLLVFR